MTARTITTAAELDALPVGAGIVDKHGDLGIIDRIIGTEGQRVVQYAETSALTTEYVAKHYLPATVVYAPSEARAESAPPVVPVVSDAAVKVVADELKAHYGPLGDPDEGTLCNCGAVVAPVGEYGVRAWREHVAGSVLDAALPFLGAAPSATREDVEHIARTLAETTALTGADAHLIVQAALALSVPSATREDVAQTIDEGSFDFPEECAGEIEQALQAAGDLLARFTITPRTDR